MAEIGSPHDRYFRESFGRIEIARDFLRHQLPPALLAEVDLDSLEIAPETHVAEDLRADWSDLVYRMACRGGGLEVYLLFEHKSHTEHWTLLQLSRYIVASGERHRKQHPEARWRAPLTFHALVHPLPPVLAPFVPQFRYALLDISERSGVEIKGAGPHPPEPARAAQHLQRPTDRPAHGASDADPPDRAPLREPQSCRA